MHHVQKGVQTLSDLHQLLKEVENLFVIPRPLPMAVLDRTLKKQVEAQPHWPLFCEKTLTELCHLQLMFLIFALMQIFQWGHFNDLCGAQGSLVITWELI